MNKKHYLVAWGYFAVYEAEIPELERPKLIDAENPDDAIALYPKQLGRGHAYVIGTVEEEDNLGVKTLAENATPMAAYPSFSAVGWACPSISAALAAPKSSSTLLPSSLRTMMLSGLISL